MQYYSLAFVADCKMATDEVSLLEIVQYSLYYLPLNVLLLPKDQTFLFYLLMIMIIAVFLVSLVGILTYLQQKFSLHVFAI